MGRDSESIILVAATKYVGPKKIEECINAGIRIIGENRVQDAERKKAIVKKEAEWHMIGHLQTNKVNKALKLFSMVQSLDTIHLAQAIQKRARRPFDVLVEVDTSGKESKFGINPSDVLVFLDKLSSYDKINIRGLMTIGPLKRNPREGFRSLYRIFCEARKEGYNMEFISMGMTDDFEIAIEEGTNMIRIGRALFENYKGD